MSLKDRLDEEYEKVEAWRPDVGGELIGKVVRVNIRTPDDPDYKPYPVVTVLQDDGTKLAFHAFHTVARDQMEQEGDPEAGDEIAVRYLGTKESAAGRQYHDYRVVVDHKVGAPSDSDFEAVAATQAAQQQSADARDEDIPF